MNKDYRELLQEWIVEALESLDGEAEIVDISRRIWQVHEQDLRELGDKFFTWQYDLRWEAKKLRDEGVLAPDEETPKGVWALRDS